MNDVLELITDADAGLGRATDAEAAIAAVTAALARHTGWTHARVLRCPESGRPSLLDAGFGGPTPAGASATAASEGRPCWAHEERDGHAVTVLSLPLLRGERVLGVVELLSDAPQEPSLALLDAASVLMRRLMGRIERLDGAAELHDGATGLPSRAAFLDHLGYALPRARRNGWSTAVMAIGIGNGVASPQQPAYEHVLAVLVDRLQHRVRGSDVPSRQRTAPVDRDRLLLLCESVGDPHGALTIAQRVVAALSLPVGMADGTVHQIWVGICFVAPGDRADPDAIVAEAERALDEARADGAVTCRFSSEPLQRRALGRVSDELELREALAHDQLLLEYQPIVALDSDRIAAVEALVRWEHPERGRIPPDAFIPLAEETRLIEQLGAWVLMTACRDAARWQRDHAVRPPLVVAVNVSAAQFGPRLTHLVERALADTGLEPSRLRLEITEGSVMADTEAALSTLGDLKAMGVGLSVDDFGTGYSSLSYLERLPVDEVKIDRSFITPLGDAGGGSPIVAAIVSLGAALRLDIVAEGVETAEQRDALREMGCDYAQGYFFARPQAAPGLERLLADAARGVRLPASSEPEATDSARPALETIVVADDALDVLQLASMSLTTAGFTVHATASGAEAVEIATRVMPDCVVLDVNMPDVSGLDVVRALRAERTTRDCVVLMLTVRSSPADKIDAFGLGVDDYIVKPFAPRELVARVRSALRRREQQRR